MKAEERAISQILTDQLRYQIPPYQRPYSWGEEQTRDLLDDVHDAMQAGEKEYFIGSLITIDRGDGVSEVVDGQQRLTTLNLVLARLREHLTDDAARAVVGNRVLPQDPLTGEQETPRLTLRPRDQKFFRDHVLEAKPVPEGARADLDAPKRRLLANMATADAFFTGREQAWLKGFASYLLNKVYVVLVRTESFRSAFRLFNVLNARGVDLSNADLVKDQLFSRVPAAHGELEALWADLEEELGTDKIDVFLGLYRTAVTGRRPTKGLADEFEQLFAEDPRPSVVLLEQMLASARHYAQIEAGTAGGPTARRSLAALRRVTYDECVPPLLAYLARPVPALDLAEYVGLLERITMQNWVRRLGRAKRNTIYSRLIKAILDGEGAEHVREHFRDGANDEEFFAILDGEVYGFPYAQAVLLRLEEGAQDDSVTKTYGGRLSIEHVLPQSLKDPYWEARFSTREQQQWLHRLGNLTLLSGMKNVLARNYAFPAKRDVYLTHNAAVSFDLTKEVCAATEWTPSVLEARHARLMDVARGLWGMT
ncbi:MAG TPA: DUF262 domain-containing HNH endonuclease family protein [Gemmatirosa sp.]